MADKQVLLRRQSALSPDKKRETTYNRRKKNVIYFYCPKCKSREIQLHLKKNHYECLDCAFTWKH